MKPETLCGVIQTDGTPCLRPRGAYVHEPGVSWHHEYLPKEETMPIPRDMETIADLVRRAKEKEAARLSAPVRSFRIRVTPPMAELGLVDGDILYLHADGTLTLEIGTEIKGGIDRGAR